MTSELWGTKNHGANYLFFGTPVIFIYFSDRDSRHFSTLFRQARCYLWLVGQDGVHAARCLCCDGADGSTAGIATPFLAKWVAQTFYTSHIDGECATVHNGTTPARCHGEACAACHGTSVCLGVDCFRNSHAVAGALAACGALCLLVLTMRKRPLYDRIWYVSVRESICDTSTCDTCRSTCDTFVASSFDLNCEWC